MPRWTPSLASSSSRETSLRDTSKCTASCPQKEATRSAYKKWTPRTTDLAVFDLDETKNQDFHILQWLYVLGVYGFGLGLFFTSSVAAMNWDAKMCFFPHRRPVWIFTAFCIFFFSFLFVLMRDYGRKVYGAVYIFSKVYVAALSIAYMKVQEHAISRVGVITQYCARKCKHVSLFAIAPSGRDAVLCCRRRCRVLDTCN